ncbi:MAG: PaaI family thioesterase [Deltaproteobacteria bacterium]|nr:PaaI family thioesterase [Deltaproteobacteria bacterium]
MDKKIKDAIFKKIEEEPFAQKFGIELIELDEGYAKVQMDVAHYMENIFGMIHGGAIFALIDEAFEAASNSHGTIALALNMNVSYIAPPTLGSRLTAEAKELSLTKRTANYDIRVYDEEGKLIALSQTLVYHKSERLPFLKE